MQYRLYVIGYNVKDNLGVSDNIVHKGVKALTVSVSVSSVSKAWMHNMSEGKLSLGLLIKHHGACVPLFFTLSFPVPSSGFKLHLSCFTKECVFKVDF